MGGEARRVAATGKVETAHGLGQRIRAILVHAVDRVDIESHLGAGLSRVLRAVEKTPMAAVTLGELPALMKSIDSYPEPVTRLGLLLLAHAFLRTSASRTGCTGRHPRRGWRGIPPGGAAASPLWA